MKKSILLALAVLASALAAEAQATWWGLWNTGFGLKTYTLFDSGTTDLYLRFTAKNSPLLVGGSVSGMRFWVADKTDIAAASVWLSEAYSRGTEPTILRKEVPVDQLNDWTHDGAPTVVLFDEAVSILPNGNPYASIFVGITLQTAAGRAITLLGTTGEGTLSNSFFRDGSDVTASYGRLPLQILAAGPLIPAEAAQVAPIHEMKALAGHPSTLSVSVASAGVAPISSIDYVVSIDGQQQPEQHYALPEPIDELGKAFEVPVSYEVPATPAKHQLSVSVTRVNGNPQSNSTAESELTALSRQCTKRTVMEEFTGSWCHNCIRGIAGISRLQEQFADRFIPIAIHSSDPMQVDAYRYSTFYKSYVAALGGLPSCALDRLIGCDPYCGMAASGPFATDQLVEYALSQTAVADVEVSAHFTEQSQTTISCTVTTHFAYNSPDAPYRLILVLTADSLTGEDRDWQQINGYNDYDGDDPALQLFAGAGSRLIPSSFNHVAIDIVGADEGIAASIVAPLSYKQPQAYTHTLSIANNALAQHKDLLHVVAMLIDTQSGSLVNAATSTVAPYGQSGIDEQRPNQPSSPLISPLSPPTSHNSYDLLGRSHPTPIIGHSSPKSIIIKNGKKRISANPRH